MQSLRLDTGLGVSDRSTPDPNTPGPPSALGRCPGAGGCPPTGRNFEQRIDMSEPARGAAGRARAKGRSSVSNEQRENLDATLRQNAFPFDSDVSEQRRLLRELASAQPLPAELTVTAAALGGVPTAEITIDGFEPRHVVLYFHGGVYVIGDAFQAAGGGRADRPADTRQGHLRRLPARPRAPVSGSGSRRSRRLPSPPAQRHRPVGHRLRGRVRWRRAGRRHPGQRPRSRAARCRAAALVMSPYADLTLSGATIDTKRAADPLFTPEAFPPRVADYTAGQDAALGLISPVFADLSGLPPLIIQAGSHEVLLDDATASPGKPPPPTSRSPSTSPRGCRTSSRPTTRSSTKRPRHWTEPDSSCRRISPDHRRLEAGAVE